MRIAMLPKPQAGIFAGLEVHMYELSRELMKKGHEVEVLCVSGTRAFQDIAVSPVCTIRSPKALEGELWFLSYVHRILKGNFDLLHIQGVGSIAPLMGVACAKRLTNSPIVCTVHSDLLHGGLAVSSLYRNWTRRRLMGYATKKIDSVIAVSELVSRSFSKLFPGKNVFVIPNGVDTNRFHPQKEGEELREKLGAKEKFMILYTGRLCWSKGLTYLLQAFRLISEKNRDFILTIVGEGACEKKLKNMAQNLGISENVKFTGFIHPSHVPNYYAASDVFVLPSIFEAFGIVLLEAMSSAKPVIATEVGGIPEIVVHNENGLLIEPRNPPKIADAILKLYHDASLRTKIAQNGRKLVEERFSWDKIVPQIIKVYEMSFR